MVRASKGMLLVKHLAPKIIMAVNYCGRKLAQSLRWAAFAYHKKDGATPHPGAHRHGLQYDGRPDERLGVRVGTWNLGSLSRNGREACEELRKRMIDMCCGQEVRKIE